MNSSLGAHLPRRRERHFGDRVISCRSPRPAGPYEAFARAVAARPAAEALVDGALRLSYAALDERSGRAAARLADRGVVAGDRVALLLGNGVEFVTTLLAILRLGAVAVPMGTRLQAPEIAYIVRHSGATLLVHDEDLASRVSGPAELPDLQHRLAVSRGAPGRASHDEPGPSGAMPAVVRPPEDAAAIILYTSGTTGRPKGAVLTALNLVHSMLNYADGLQVGAADRTLLAVPASHVTGLLANVMLAWQAQCTLIVLNEFKVRAFLELAARERMTHTVLVPAMLKLCLLQPDLERFDLAAWRVGGFGGAPMAEATIAELAQKLPRLGLVNIYGATETTGPVTMLPSARAAERPDSVGQVLAGAEIVVMDADGCELPRGTAGELWIRGPMVVPGYWADAEATRQNFVGGFWRSGDLGSIDAEGFVRLSDRMKDMLNRGGFKVYSVEVEHVLLEHPAVVESAVVGRACPVLGERVHAYVCLKENTPVTADVLRRFCAERLADYKVPETFTLGIEALPRNANGKLLKRALRELLASAGA